MAKALFITAHALRWGGRWLWRLLLATILLLAIGLLGLRWLAPQWVDWRTEAQHVLSDVLQLPVSLQNIELAWWGWGPELQVQELHLLFRK